MNKSLRIIIAIVSSFLALAIAVSFQVFFFEGSSVGISALISVAAGFGIYKAIKPSKKEIIVENTEEVVNYHDNGIAKERGTLIHGKRHGEWEYFNEEGVLIKEDIYNNGELSETIEY